MSWAFFVTREACLLDNVVMDMIKLPSGEIKLLDETGEYRLLFLSPVCFRLHKAGSLHSACVGKLAHAKDEVELEGHEVSYGELRLHFDAALNLKAYFRGKLCVQMSPHMLGKDERDLSLMEKEGHESNKGDEYQGGVSFINDSPIYGLGDKTGPLDKRGYDYINWNTDDPTAHVDTYKSLYKSIPFFLMFHGEDSVGVFLDNTSKCRFDFNKENPSLVSYDYSLGGLDMYCFFGSMPDVIADYTSIVGRNPLPPRWSLGAQQSRWSYSNKEEVEAVVKGYAEADIPLSCVHLDIDYMDRYMDFTVDPKRFPDFKGWAASLLERGVRLVTIIDAGVKALPGYDVYDQGVEKGYFCTQNGEVYHNEVWPGDSVFPAFYKEEVRQWWGTLVAKQLESGASGIWNDMNEPASFKGPLPPDVDMGGLPHSLCHNIYGHLMDEATYLGFEKAGRRPYIITRAAYAGTARYSTMWTGDNQSIYEHIRLMIPQLSNMSVSGVANVGNDIGGFGGDCTPELLAKWATAAIFNPLYRNHSSMGTKPQEPYTLHGEFLDAYRKAILTRYELIPTIYDALFMHESSGLCVLRPLVYNFPDDPEVRNENTEIMLSDSLLLAPSLFPGEKVRSAYFPDDFYSYFTGEKLAKGHHLIDVSIGSVPLYIRAHSIIAVNAKGTKTTDFSNVLRLIWTGDEAACYHYEDAGDGLGYKKGEYNLFLIRASLENGVCVIPVHLGIKTHYKSIEISKPGEDPMVKPFIIED